MAKSGRTRGNNGYRRKSNGSGNRSHRIFDDVLAMAGTLAEHRKDYGADKIYTFAEATRDYATSMGELPYLRTYLTSAAESLEGISDYVMETDVEAMLDDAANFARRNPVATFAATVAIGLAASRLISSGRNTPRPVKSASRTKRASSRKQANA